MASETNLRAFQAQSRAGAAAKTVFPILLSISVCHLLNDTLQSLIPAIYPLLKSSFHLDFSQVGLIALTLQLTASLLQPVVWLYSPSCCLSTSAHGFVRTGLFTRSRSPLIPSIWRPWGRFIHTRFCLSRKLPGAWPSWWLSCFPNSSISPA